MRRARAGGRRGGAAAAYLRPAPPRPTVPKLTSALAALALAGCSLFAEEGIDRTFLLPVVDLDVPETAAVGEPFAISVRAQTTNGCITYEGTEVSRQGDQLSVAVGGRERVRPGEECAAVVSDVDETVRYTPRQPGELLVVARGYDGLLERSVRVE